MKFVTKLSIFITVLALVSGCVSKREIDSQTRIPSQPNREEAIKSDDKTPVKGVEGTDNEDNGETVDAQKTIIGLVINAKKFPTHTHIGTTKFNNFTKEYNYDWQLHDTVFTIFEKAIEQGNRFDVLDISSTVESTGTLDFVKSEDGNMVFNNNLASMRKSLLDKGITRIIVIKEAPTVAITECGTYGCSEHKSNGFGLFTRSFLGTDYYVASASFDVSIESLDEPVDLTALPDFAQFNDDEFKNKRIEEFETPVDFDDLTNEELAPIKSTIVDYFEGLAKKVSMNLSRQ